MRTSRLTATAALAMLPFSALLFEGEAKACGGCFHGEPPPEQPIEQTSVVTDHRMVFSISTKQTILWDQVRYTGDPGEFAWVLPVRAGARVELSNDEWLAALDSTTRTTIQGPTPKTCPGSFGGSNFESSGGGGCGSSDMAASSFSGGEVSDASAKKDSGEDVEILKQEVVGPYEVVTLRSSVDDAIDKWLRANGFVIPPEIAPLLRDYTNEKFDFIALKLRPGQSVRAMQPVRIVTPGADASMPLRMVAAGVGARVGMTLWVIGEGRYHTQNFPDAVIDFTKLTWDPLASRSNYTLLADTELSKQEGRAWITETSNPAQLSRFGTNDVQATGPLGNAYFAACPIGKTKRVPCTGSDAGPVPPLPDAGDAGTISDASTDSAPPKADAGCFETVDACDDLNIATEGMHIEDVWVTRLRAFLPVAALNEDLSLEASQSQTTMPGAHSTETYSDPSYDPCPPSNNADDSGTFREDDDGCACKTASSRDRFSSFFLVGGTAMIGAAAIRRRRRRF